MLATSSGNERCRHAVEGLEAACDGGQFGLQCHQACGRVTRHTLIRTQRHVVEIFELRDEHRTLVTAFGGFQRTNDVFRLAQHRRATRLHLGANVARPNQHLARFLDRRAYRQFVALLQHQHLIRDAIHTHSWIRLHHQRLRDGVAVHDQSHRVPARCDHRSGAARRRGMHQVPGEAVLADGITNRGASGRPTTWGAHALFRCRARCGAGRGEGAHQGTGRGANLQHWRGVRLAAEPVVDGRACRWVFRCRRRRG